MSLQAKGQMFYDAVIVGAGPAGVSCAVWLSRLGFKPVLVDTADGVGGLCRINPFMDDWNASLPGVNGLQVAQNLAESLVLSNVTLHLGWAVQAAQAGTAGFEILSAKGETIKGRFLVLATGVKARGLNSALPEHEFAHALDGAKDVPRILVGPGEHVAGFNFTNKRVAVLGGGDNAFENALFALEKGAQSVRVFARTVRAQRQFVQKLPADCLSPGAYEVDTRRVAVNGSAFDVLLVMYGWTPNVDFATSLGLERTARGFISIDFETAQTSFDGVYAVGEVASRQHPCVVTALADGVTAAKAIQARLEAEMEASDTA
ncbi:MAG: NAD(P)/FAD-dependent oxidoreductase [Pusillimonas sp.]|nr:NAD(P)/FAD-dependent oxidoreductase [Pusillimonas sp.]